MGRLTTCAEVVVKANSYCHDGCWKDTGVKEFLSSLHTSASNDFAPPSTAIQSLLLETPDTVRCLLPTIANLIKQLTKRRRNHRVHVTTQATCAGEVEIPLPTREDSTAGLLVIGDMASRGKRVFGIASEATLSLSVLNQRHKYIFLDGTFRISLKFFTQIWIVRLFVFDTDEVASLALFLLEFYFSAYIAFT